MGLIPSTAIINGSGKAITFPLTLTLSPNGEEGIEKEFF